MRDLRRSPSCNSYRLLSHVYKGIHARASYGGPTPCKSSLRDDWVCTRKPNVRVSAQDESGPEAMKLIWVLKLMAHSDAILTKHNCFQYTKNLLYQYMKIYHCNAILTKHNCFHYTKNLLYQCMKIYLCNAILTKHNCFQYTKNLLYQCMKIYLFVQ